MSDPVFFAPARSLTVAEAASLTDATLLDPATGHTTIRGIASAIDGGPGTVVFVEGKRMGPVLTSLRASAVFCSSEWAALVPPGIAVLVTPKPQGAFAALGRILYPPAARPLPTTGETGISDRAVVDPSAQLESGVIVEAGAVIGPGAAIGSGTVIAPNAVIGASCRLGRDCYVGPGATVQYALLGNGVIIHTGARIGQDGFGFVAGAGKPERIPQIGRVIIQDNVEIGANTTVDRGALSDTVIGENSKIDNLCQIAHNVRLGRGCLIAGRTGISGSCVIGDGVMMGGGVGLADHLTVGDGAQLAAGGGFMHNVPAGEIWGGFPAKPLGQAFREFAAIARLARRKPSTEKGDG